MYSLSHEFNTLIYDTPADATTNKEKYIYTAINVTLSTINNIITEGNPNNLIGTRILFEFLTHNGAFNSWDEDMTGNKLTVSAPASCGGLFNYKTRTKTPTFASFNSYKVGTV